MPQPWPARDLAVVVRDEVARRMLDRARAWDVDEGGRFDARSGSILVWSTSLLAAAADRAEPIGAIYFRWHTPTDELATIWKIEWDPAQGGTEAEVWDAIRVLAGAPIGEGGA